LSESINFVHLPKKSNESRSEALEPSAAPRACMSRQLHVQVGGHPRRLPTTSRQPDFLDYFPGIFPKLVSIKILFLCDLEITCAFSLW
jgi:hypothetical protein